jgi:membrane associated rhomboid family serine protease
MAAGLALLAMLGTTGTRVDVWAHLFGLLVGGALGLPIGLLVHLPPNLRVQRLLGGSALAVVILSWMLAIR